MEELPLSDCPMDTNIHSDNPHVVSALETPKTGLLHIVTEQSMLPLADAQKFIEALLKHHRKSKHVANINPRRDGESFKIIHRFV